MVLLEDLRSGLIPKSNIARHSVRPLTDATCALATALHQARPLPSGLLCTNDEGAASAVAVAAAAAAAAAAAEKAILDSPWSSRWCGKSREKVRKHDTRTNCSARAIPKKGRKGWRNPLRAAILQRSIYKPNKNFSS